MAAARLIICEKSGSWATAVRVLADRDRELADVSLRQTPLLEDCWQELAAAPASVVLVELGGDGAFDLIRDIGWQFPQALVVVVAEPRWAEYQALCLELGAALFVTSPRRLQPVLEMMKRRGLECGRDSLSALAAVPRVLPW